MTTRESKLLSPKTSFGTFGSPKSRISLGYGTGQNQVPEVPKPQDVTAPQSNQHTEPDYVVRLKPLKGFAWRTPPWMRLRALLKRALRDYGLRCTEVRPGRSGADKHRQA